MFLLCTYIDNDRWPSAFEPLLYPTGVSFYRPFSYRKEYFVPDQLAEQLSDPTQVTTLIKTPTWNDVIFGIRFREQTDPDFRPVFIPLRKVHLVASERQDELNISFALGDFIEPLMASKGNPKRLPSLDLTSSVSVSDVKLFLQLTEPQVQETKKWSFRSSFPQDFWDAFVNSLSAVARQKVRDATILRLDGL